MCPNDASFDSAPRYRNHVRVFESRLLKAKSMAIGGSVQALVLSTAFDIETRIGPPQLSKLCTGELVVDLLYVDEFLDSKYLTGDMIRVGVVNCEHALAQAEGFQDTGCLLGQTDG